MGNLSSTAIVLLNVGLVCVVAAIVGGGVSFKGLTIPKMLSVRRQQMLGAFGGLLILLALGFLAPVLHLIWNLIIPILVIGFFVIASIPQFRRERRYKELWKDHVHQPDHLLEDAEKAFWEKQYEWAIKFVCQAKAAARDDSWERGYAFLLGAQVGRGRKGAARTTRTEIVNSIEMARASRTGYLSSVESLRQLAANLTAASMEVGKGGQFLTRSNRTEIQLVLEAVKEAIAAKKD
jgi:hypothetical protein